MFGLGWSEMVLVGIVALIVIGPKDLPGMFKAMGEFTGKAKRMASEFSRAMEAAADDAGVKDIQKTINAAANPQKFGVDKIREATTGQFEKGKKTQELSEERAAAKARMDAKATELVEKRKAAEAEAAATKPAESEPAPAKDASE